MSSLEAPNSSKFKQIDSKQPAPAFSPRINNEIDQKINEFIEANPKLAKAVQKMPKEYLERKYLLGKMEQRERQKAYNITVKTWLNKPEQADLKKTLENIVPSHNNEAVVLNQAKNHLRNSGIKLR